MLTQDELIKQISATMGKVKVIKLTALLNEQQFPLAHLIDITFHADKNIAFRASWLLENRLIKGAEQFAGDLPYLFQQFTQVNYPSCQRHYANTVIRLTSPKANKIIKDNIAAIDLNR
jgi:hypothetical protein